MPISPARAAAFDILVRVEQEDAYASELLHSPLCERLKGPDQGLATELVMGVLRWRSSLDTAIARASTQSLDRLDPEVLIALRLAVYQLGWLERVPAHAAIHESVELVKRARKRSAAAFVNAVLRKIAGNAVGLRAPHDALSSDPAVIAHTSAHPLWIIERWISQFGSDVAHRICLYDQSIPVTCIRLRTASAEDELKQEGIGLAPGLFLASARRVISGDVTKTRAYIEARIAIQDEASQLVAALLGQGPRILDCCAAPGGKTWSIADRNPEAQIIAVEMHEHRAALLRKRVRAHNVQVVHADIREFPAGQPFDRVLVDVPCSGTGTIARNPEIKWRLKPADLADLQSRQLAILKSAMQHVGEHGRLLYSTCSLEPEENERVIEEALREHPSFRLIAVQNEIQRLQQDGEWIMPDAKSVLAGKFLRTVPGLHSCDGFFAAVLERFET